MKDKTNKIVVKYYFPVLFESLKLFYISIIIAKNKKLGSAREILTWQNAKLSSSEGTPLFSNFTSSCSEKSGLWRNSNASQLYDSQKGMM